MDGPAEKRELQDRLAARAAALVPDLLDRAGSAESARRIPDSTHRAFVEAGFYRIFQPARWGGLECDFRMLVDVAAELGRGCGSSAWVFTNLAAQSWILGMARPEAQADVWGAETGALMASGFAVRGGRARDAEGGVALDGLWSFSSGVDFCDWLNLQVFLPRAGGPPEHRFALVPMAEIEIVDDWDSTGLLATGSKSVLLKDVFVPDYRTLPSAAISGGRPPGAEENPAPLFRLSPWSTGTQIFSGPAYGIARGALEQVERAFADRVGVTGAKLAELPTAQVRVAEAASEIDAAGALLVQCGEESMRHAEAEDHPPLAARARWRRNNAYATQLCVRAVERLYPLMGARGLARSSPFMRAWRDVHAVSMQITQAWDIQSVNAGRIRFGLPSMDPRL